MDKYQALLHEYKTSWNEQEIQQSIAQILAQNLTQNSTLEVYKTIFNCIDLTSLNSTDHTEKIVKWVEKVNLFDEHFVEIGNVAALCVYPNFTAIVRGALQSNAKVAAVAGGFPSSQTFTEVKVAETLLAIGDGADEIDIVMHVGNFLAGNYEEVCDEISELKEVCRGKTLKVIVEAGLLGSAENIAKASLLSIASGADFIKTSTGKTEVSATLEAAYVMCQIIKQYYDKTGEKIGFKAAGGIVSTEDAVKYYSIAKHILGEEWMNESLFRIGASRLANNLLTSISGKETVVF